MKTNMTDGQKLDDIIDRLERLEQRQIHGLERMEKRQEAGAEKLKEIEEGTPQVGSFATGYQKPS
jgi:hypothetical protein